MAAPVKAARQQTTLSGTLRNLPEVASGTYTSTHRNPPDPEPASGTYTSTHRNLQNLPPEPAAATRTGTHRSLSGLKTPLAHAVGEKTKTCFIAPAGDSIYSQLDSSIL